LYHRHSSVLPSEAPEAIKIQRAACDGFGSGDCQDRPFENYLKQPNGETSAYLKRFREALTGARSVPSDGQSTLPDVHEFEVDALALADQSLREARIRERFGVTVVPVRRGSGELFVNPEPDTVVKAGDRIRVFGLPNQILMSAKGDE
jgi:hypothetical protein